MTLHIYAPPVVTKEVVTMRCPDCQQRTRMLVFTYEWHGPNATCILCGRSWSNGEWLPLPFVRQSRAKEIERAKEIWRRAKPIGLAEMHRRSRAVDAMLAARTEGDAA